MLFETIRNNTPNFMLITLAYAKHHIENAKNIISYAYDFVVNPLIKTYHLVVETFSHAIKSSEKESGELPLAPDLPNSKKEKEDSDDETPFSKAPYQIQVQMIRPYLRHRKILQPFIPTTLI